MSSPNMAPTVLEPTPVEAMQAPESTGLSARVGNFVSRVGDALSDGYHAVADRYEAIKDQATTLAAIGGIAFVGAQAAELAVAAEPVAAEGNTPTATASNLRQYCGRTMSHLFPEVVERIPGTPYVGTVLSLPGKYRQTMGVYLETKDIPAQCDEAGYDLKGRALPLLAQPDNHHDLYQFGTVGYHNRAGKRQQAFPNIASYERDNYRCTPGPGKTPVYLDLDNTVLDPRGHEIAEATQRHRVPVLNPDRSNAAC